MSSCDCSRPVVILQGASGLSTLYTSNGTLLGDRVVSANNNDLTFNMGTGVFTVNGLVAVSGLDLLALTSNPGDSTTLWVSGNDLYLGSENLSLKISNNAGNILTFGTDSGIFLDATIICNAINNCTLSQLGDVSNSVASSGHLLFYNGTNWIPKSVSIDSLSDVYLVSAPTTGQTLIWSAVYSAYIPGTVMTNLSISGAGSTQSITPSETLKFAASGDLSLSVASDTVTYGFNEYVTTLSYDSGTNKLTYTNESGTTVNITLTDLEFDCSDLASCSISGLGDVSTAGATNGQVLTYNGSAWVPQTTTAFSCSSLNTCSIDALSDVVLGGTPSNGQVLGWSSVYSAFIPSTPYTSFSVTDGVISQTISNGNTLTFVGVSGASVSVAPIDTVRIALNETTTSLTFNSGTNTLSFTDEDGAVHNILLTSAASFSCASLNSCTVDQLSDVLYVSAPTSNQVLVWSAVYSAWIPSTPFTSFTITDGTTSQTISNGNSLTFSGAGNVETTVSATDTVTISYTDVLTTLTYNSGTHTLTYTDEEGTPTALDIFDCTYLNNCSISELNDVDITGAANGKVLAYDGANWVPTTISVGGSGFSCLSLSGCNASALADVAYPSAPSSGDVLAWSVVYSGWIPTTPFSSFTISDGTTSQTISNGNTISFSGVSGVDVVVTATDRVNISFTETVTSLLYNSGLNRLTYTNESGGVNVINLLSSTGTGAFSCASLSTCSIENLSDVVLAGPTHGQVLMWDSGYLSFVNSDVGNFFTITDGTNNQIIANANTITFSGAGNVDVTVGATDKVTISYLETLTSLAAVSGHYLRYTDESGAKTEVDVCVLLNGCSLNALSDVDTTGATTGYLLTYSGSTWIPAAAPGGGGFVCSDLNSCSITALSDVSGTPSNAQALVWDAGYSQYKPSGLMGSFNITDGFNPQAITNGNSIVFAAGGDLTVATSATDTVTYSFTETVTTLTFNGGTRNLAYTSEDGTVTNVTIPSGFDCSFLNSCSVDSLSDVNTAGVVSGNYLKYNGSAWVPAAAPTVNVSADAGNDLTLGGDSLPYFAEVVTTLSKSGVSYIKYVNEAGTETTVNICELLSGCSVNSLADVTVSSPSVNQIMRWNGSAWINDNESVAGSYTFTISDGSTSQTINSGNTLTFADSPCINATVSATDTVTFTPVIAGSRTISSATYGDDIFDNALICATGLFVPCIKVTEPTLTTGNDKLLLQIPCGGSEWNQYEIPYFDNIKRVGSDLVTAVVDGDAATVGVDLVVDGNTGELFYNSVVDDTYRKVRSTYGYTESSAFTAATPRTITHNLDCHYVIVQVYLDTVSYDELQSCTIRILSENTVSITTPVTGTHKVCILPVFPLV